MILILKMKNENGGIPVRINNKKYWEVIVFFLRLLFLIFSVLFFLKNENIKKVGKI